MSEPMKQGGVHAAFTKRCKMPCCNSTTFVFYCRGAVRTPSLLGQHPQPSHCLKSDIEQGEGKTSIPPILSAAVQGMSHVRAPNGC